MLLRKKSIISNLKRNVPNLKRNLLFRRNVFPYDIFPSQENVSYKTDTTFVNKIINAPSVEISINDLIDQIKKREINNVVVNKKKTQLVAITNKGEFERVEMTEEYDIMDYLFNNKVNIKVFENAENEFNYFIFMLQLVFFYILTVFITSRINASNMKNIMNNNKSEINEQNTDITFSDVAGVDNAKYDLMEIVEFLKFPEKYTKLGAKIPKGALLVGPPGTGKTLLARAVAGEAGVPFFSCSGSEFIEMFVGVGASRIRSLFKKAMEKAPCIIFIDEIDAIGKQRSSTTFSGSNDERDQTINQLLVEMDGFKGNTGVIVMAATNRADMLDEALLRPGRFDRHIEVDLPDKKGRNDILKIHTNNKPLDKSLSLETVAANTAGFSGADLQNLANEAAIYTARRNGDSITLNDFESALDKMTIGEERKTILINDNKKEIIAYHEAGHALMSLLVNDFDKLRKISIIPRGDAGGITYFEPSDDRIDIALLSREYLENQILVALGGRIAEELIFGEEKITTGAAGDFKQVYNIASQMVINFGFSENLGKVYWGETQGLQYEIDLEIKNIVDELYSVGYDLLNNNIKYLKEIAEALLEKEILTYEDIMKIYKQ